MNLIRALLITLIFFKMSYSQNPDFILSTDKFQPYFPAYVGNGHFSLASSHLGTLPAESYMIKFFDKGKDDIPRIACLPEWNEINYFNSSKWLNDAMNDSSEFSNYLQKLDMYNGILETRYNWSSGDRRTDIDIHSFISRSNNNLAVIKFEITPQFSDSIRLTFPLNEKERPKRMALAKLKKIDPNKPGAWPAEWYPGFTEIIKINAASNLKSGSIHALAQSEGRNTKAAIAVEVFADGLDNPKFTTSQEKNLATIEIRFLPEKGKTYTFYKLVSVVPEFINKEDILKSAVNIVHQARNTGYNILLAEHKQEWERLWQTDIIVNGDDEYQKIIHSMIYYLISSVDENTGYSLSPMGLSTAGYYGHIFWDADTYMFPPLMFMYPDIAKSMVMFRYHTLEAAMENAKKNNYKGAMYPWESDELGEETTPFFAYQNALGENHIVGDVALAQWQYYLATKDENWLRDYGSKVITATADFWTSRVHYNEKKDQYEIGRVVSVSEGLTDVSNETYTNSIAKINLELAVKTADLLKIEKNPEWEKISQKLLIPYNKEKEYHPTFENAAEGEGATELWSSVTPLLTFPLQMEMNENAKRNNLFHAVKSLEENGAGANMGINFLPIIAAELKNDSLFNLTISKTLKGYLRPPFNSLAETHTNNSINFITGAGAFLQQVIFGYTGLRLTEKGLIEKYRPMLPEKIKSLTLKGFTINNKKYDVVVEKSKLRMNIVK